MNADEFERQRAVEARHAWFVGRRRAVRPLLERAQAAAPAGAALDLGVGTGGNTAFFEGLLADRPLLGIDASPCARGARLLRADAHALPLAACSLGLVVSLDVLEHCADDARVLAELARCLRPGGQLVLNVPAFARLFGDHDRALGHVRRYERGELEARLAAAGFVLNERRAFNIATLAPLALARRWRARSTTPRSDVRALPAALNRALGWTLALEERLPQPLKSRYGLSWMMRAARR